MTHPLPSPGAPPPQAPLIHRLQDRRVKFRAPKVRMRQFDPEFTPPSPSLFSALVSLQGLRGQHEAQLVGIISG